MAQRFIAGLWREHKTSPVRDERTHLLASLQFLLRCFRHVYFGRADLFDFNRRGAVHVKFIAVEVHFAGYLKLKLGQRAVLDSKLHRPFGVADRPEPELRFRTVFGEIARIDVAVLLQFFGGSREFGGLRGRHLEVSNDSTEEASGALGVVQIGE